MLVPREEIARYTSFAIRLVRRLKSLAIDPEAMVWHYTSGVGLLGIVSSQSIYATHVSCLSDSSEIRYASLIFREALGRLASRQSAGSEESVFIAAALKYFAEDPTSPNHVALPNFVACFSEIRDDLSQWRAYAGGENGYAIGFRAKHLYRVKTCLLARVTYYNEKEHQVIIDEVAEATVRFFREGLLKYGAGAETQWTEDFLNQWDLAITQVAPLIKHSAFSSERECRLSKGYIAEELQELQFRQKNTMLTRHLPLRPQYDGQPNPYRLPISEIIVGPCRHPHVSRISLGTLLQQNGYDPSIVKLSEIPFQLT